MIIDWSDKTWSYLLGVVHGDGNVAPRSISISVGYKDSEYAEILIKLWESLGYTPKTYRPRSALRIDVHSKELAIEFSKFKKKGIWSLPANIDSGNWLAGVFDTDGSVTMAQKKCAVIITLKRSGNLNIVADLLGKIGVEGVKVYDRVRKFKGDDYLVEELRLTSFDKILKFSEFVNLRYPNKTKRLLETVEYIHLVKAKVPVWKQVGFWLEEEPRTWEEIAAQFNLTKDQVGSVLQFLKKNAEVEIIPPPKILTKYHVKGLSSFQDQ